MDKSDRDIGMLMQEYYARTQAAAIGAQTTTIHVATGMIAFAGSFTVLIDRYSSGGTPPNRWWWLLLPVLPLFHLGWTTFRFLLQCADEAYLCMLETEISQVPDVAYPPFYARMSRRHSSMRAPYGSQVVASIGALFYVLSQVALIVEGARNGVTDSNAFPAGIVILLWSAIFVACVWNIVFAAMRKDRLLAVLLDAEYTNGRGRTKRPASTGPSVR